MTTAAILLRLHLGPLDPNGIGRARLLLGRRLIAAFDTTRAEFRCAVKSLRRQPVSRRLSAKAVAEADRRQSLGRTYVWAA